MTTRRVETSAPPADRTRWFLAGSIAITLALFYVPYGRQIGFPLVLISTVAHEFGHALAALLVGGSVSSVEISVGAGGLAHTGGYDGRFASAFVSAGGLVGPAFAATLCFVFARSPRLARFTLLALAFLLGLTLALWMRNLFGFAYVALLATAFLAVGSRGRPATAQLVLVFVAVQLALSVYSRGDYLFTRVAVVDGAEHPSDVANIASNLFLPYWFWGGLCALLSAMVLLVGIWLFLRVGRRAPGTLPARAEALR